MQYGLIGEKLGHSFSVDIHARLGDYDYQLCPLAPEELDGFMRAREFEGINVTIPYKQAVIPYLDEVDGSAAAIGAVNTIVKRGGRLIGYNTDFYGMSRLIERIGIDINGANVAILGTGGTSKTAFAVAGHMGAARVVKVSRTPSGAEEISYGQLYAEAAGVNVIINTTPVGMYPKNEGCPLELDSFTALRGLVDAVYNPLHTNLVLAARERGIPAEGGLYMLVAQGTKAAAYFFDDEGMTERTDAVYSALYGLKRNVVLIGMPGSGKTTVGGRLASLMGRQIADSDDGVVAAVGMTIPDYFESHGESAFRDRESEVIASLAQQGGMVIATGGGAVLRECNLRALRRNGIIVFIDRSVQNILPTADRPLSRDREALQRRYEERYPIYCAAADVKVDGNGSVDEVADTIIKAITESTV